MAVGGDDVVVVDGSCVKVYNVKSIRVIRQHSFRFQRLIKTKKK